ncbi:hypothetical protein [Ruminococcus sp. HUN007]|uniref:hypothetical protein n=1 Tax=Ruminococcus sp. HUN007 TaxID=1514668 RepID=UPI0005D2588C|nr:hypothetical protein [Ruminococcus sp. HUN007]
MKLSYREKVGLLIVVILAVVIVFIAWPIKIIKGNIKNHKEEQAKIKVTYEDTQRKIDEIPVIEGNIKAVYEGSKDLSSKFVEHMSNVEVAKYFETLLNKAPYKKAGKNDLEIKGALKINDAETAEIPFYYYVPDVITYPILEKADTNGDLLEKKDSKLYEKAMNAVRMEELEEQEIEVRTVTVPMRFTKEALLKLEDELKDNETGIRISSVKVDDYTFGYITELPEDKGYSEGEVVFTFYTMQKIEEPDFSK